MELRTRRGVGLDPRRPPDRHRVAGAAEVPGQDHRALVRGAAGPGPARVVDGVALRAAENIETAEFLQRLQLLFDRGDDAVVGHQLADRAFLALRRGAVVAPDVKDQRVVAVPERVDLVDDPPGLDVRVFAVRGAHLHQPALERPLALGDALPRRHLWVPRGELRAGWDPAFLLGPFEHALPVGVPSVVELAPVLVDVLLRRVVRAVDGAARPVHEERLVRGQGLVLVQPPDGVIGQILVQVVPLFGGLRGQHERRVPDQVRLELRGLAREEPVEVLEPRIRRPVLERAGRTRLAGRRVVPLAPASRGVAVILEHFRAQGAALRDAPRKRVPVVGELCDHPGAHLVMIASGQQRCPGRGAQRRGVEPVESDSLAQDAIQRRRADLAAERRWLARARVIHQDDQDVRRVGRHPPRRDPLPVHRLLHRQAGNTRRRGRREGKRVLPL